MINIRNTANYSDFPFPSLLFLLLFVFSTATICSAATSGLMTMWGEGDPGPVTGGSCEYASDASTQKGSEWLDPYVRKLHYCAVDSNLYQSGKGCGKCFRLLYDGTGGTDPGRAGSADIQVVDSGSAKEFDCHLTAFQEITGANTGVFPISYTEISCSPIPTPTVVVLDGDNAYYIKVLFAGGPTSVESATITVGTKSYTFAGNNGATYYTGLDGTTNQQTKFQITYSDGTKRSFDKCFNGAWPVQTGSQCVESTSATPTPPVSVPNPVPGPLPSPTNPQPVQKPVQKPATEPAKCRRLMRKCSTNEQCCRKRCRRGRCL